ncbi:galactose mutarotase [Candidatus Bipolaricaulota bacterium]|nr:galactose mutarotase [Candidatus Bipolaricaulota bacterium]
MIKSELWGKRNSREVFLYTLNNERGSKVKLTNYGARITSLLVPDRNGDPVDVVLGFDNPQDYFEDDAYFGAMVGRYANRINRGNFSLGATAYSLIQNDDVHHLHGGYRGFDSKIWSASCNKDKDEPAIELEYLSEAGEEGYPGNLRVTVTYKLTRTNELIFKIAAVTDQATIANITNHNYYNLSGGTEKVNNHKLKIYAEQFAPVDKQGIPYGELLPVEGKPFDFRESRRIGERISTDDQQLRNRLGYDHNFVLKRKGTGTEQAARVYEPSTGISLTLKTTEPGIQFYTANFLKDNLKGKEGASYGPLYGLCLEPQYFPDSPNHPNFPSAVVRPGNPYKHETVLDFEAEG